MTEMPTARSKLVDFPNYGKIRIVPIHKVGQVPRVELRSPDEGLLLLSIIPAADPLYKVDAEDPDLSVPLFGTLHLPGISGLTLLAVTKNYHATDCEYVPTMAAIMNNNPKLLTPPIPSFYNRGGIGIKTRSNNAPPTLYVWSERYQGKDVHYLGPSKFEVFAYEFDSSRQAFILKKQQLEGADHLRVPKNLLELLPHLTDC